MTYLVVGKTITDAWLEAVAYLRTSGREEFGLVVDIMDSRPAAADPSVIAALNRLLISKGLQRVTTVANTIFPARIAQAPRSAEHLYERYERMLPILHRDRKNRRGTYFERLIAYPLTHDGKAPANQLRTIISDLQTEIGHRGRGQGAKRHIFEA